MVPGVGPRKPAAALRRSRATAAVLPLLLLLRLSLNDGLVLNCPPRGAEQSQHQHRTTAAVLLLLWNLLSTARTAILQLASTATYMLIRGDLIQVISSVKVEQRSA